MSTTADLVTAAVLFGPGTALAAAVLPSIRRSRIDSAAVHLVLAESAAARAAAALEQDGPTPPTDREPAPETAPAPTARLATVLPFPAARRAA
ncbi:hypothetical protein F4556_003620 [Kitasatospora gansuensis]|uniref:Uncharacterized protein n=1 Tax=Kitasatospora gansuensis TaxID=258050 RepID=A0A7W7SCS1_9ACTN|nr:hypothetical protein [Kitasatospora gansuensis]MBB4948085.1 hypothetical protein [Kitasatospora gansuensis]